MTVSVTEKKDTGLARRLEIILTVCSLGLLLGIYWNFRDLNQNIRYFSDLVLIRMPNQIQCNSNGTHNSSLKWDFLKYWKEPGPQLSLKSSGKWQASNLPQVIGQEDNFRSAIRKKFLSVRVVKNWKMLPKDAVDATSLEVFRAMLDGSWELEDL